MEGHMTVHFDIHALLFITAMQMVLAASVAAPEASFGLWLRLRNLPERYRISRAEKKSLELEKRLKKCWLVDMRKTR